MTEQEMRNRMKEIDKERNKLKKKEKNTKNIFLIRD